MSANELRELAQPSLLFWGILCVIVPLLFYFWFIALRGIFMKRNDDAHFFSKTRMKGHAEVLVMPALLSGLFVMAGGIPAITDKIDHRHLGEIIEKEYSLYGASSLFPLGAEFDVLDAEYNEPFKKMHMDLRGGEIQLTDENGKSVDPAQYKRLSEEEIVQYVEENTTLEDIEVFYTKEHGRDAPRLPSLEDLDNPSHENKFGVRGTYEGNPITLRVVRDGDAFGVDFLEDSAIGLERHDIFP